MVNFNIIVHEQEDLASHLGCSILLNVQITFEVVNLKGTSSFSCSLALPWLEKLLILCFTQFSITFGINQLLQICSAYVVIELLSLSL
jgi:hypothetical protein